MFAQHGNISVGWWKISMAYQPTKAQQHKNGAITHTYLKMLGKMDKNMKNPPWQIKAIDQIRNSLNEL